MTILVTGATGTIGKQVLANLVGKGAEIHALTRDPAKAALPTGVMLVKGEMLDVGAMRAALKAASTLFLLNAVSADELTQAMLTLNLAREAGIKRVVYFSVFNAETFTNVPHFTGKHAVERMITDLGIPTTILRPNCFMQNDLWLKAAITGHGVYPFPIGGKGVSMVDVRDIGEIAALALLARENGDVMPTEVLNLSGPDTLTGAGNATVWSEVLGKSVAYPGDDTAGFEAQMGAHGPSWAAMDMRLMLDRFQQDGMAASAADTDKLTTRLGRKLRTYRAFAEETANQWQKG